MTVGQPVNETGERLFMISSTVGFDPSLPIIGAIFCLRDYIQEALGRWWTWFAIFLGTMVSYVIAPEVAVASACAFFASELIDWGTYILTSFFSDDHSVGVLVSGVAGSMVDSAVFLFVAFSSLDTWSEQTFGKIITVIIVSVILKAYRQWLK